MRRSRALALAAIAAALATVAFTPTAAGHRLKPIVTDSFQREGSSGVYRYFSTTVPARHTHKVRCPRGYWAYPDRVYIGNRSVRRHEQKFDDQGDGNPLMPEDHEDDNEIGVTFEGRGVHVEISSPNFRRLRDPSDFNDSGPRYGRTFSLHADGRRVSRLRVLCYDRRRG